MLLTGDAATPEEEHRFRTEAEAAASLDHPNIVPIYEVGQHKGRRYFSMKLVEGWNLAERVAESACPLSQTDAARIVATSARAVHYAHQRGVLHRDIKPGNILLDERGQPQLTDFGLAKRVEVESGLTLSGEVLGSPSFLSPEQAAGRTRQLTTAVDIWGLGAVLYFLLTGQPPFAGATPLETMRRVVEEEPLAPSRVVGPPAAAARRGTPGPVDRDLDTICLRCLEKDPQRRYASADALAEDLERWLRHEPIQARPTSPAMRLARWTRRNRLGTALILTLCVGLVVTLVLLKLKNDAKERMRKALDEVRQADEANATLVVQLRKMLETELEGLWLSNERRWLEITSEQLKALDGQPLQLLSKAARSERYTFGLAANESPVSDARRYALLLTKIENQLSVRRGHPVRLDLYMFKFKEDRLQALVSPTNWLDRNKSNLLDFARMGPFVYLQAKQQHPGIQALVQMDSPARQATFFTRSNATIRAMADLKGRSIAFGDWTEDITVWAQDKLKSAGLSGQDLGKYTSFDSRSEFITEVQELGYQAAVRRRQWLHNTADVIEAVLDGRFDAGMTTMRGFDANRLRDGGLVQIPGSEFYLNQSPWVGREGLPGDLKRDFIEVLTSLSGDVALTQLPGKPTGFKPVSEATHAPERAALQRTEGLFPVPSVTRLRANVPSPDRPPEN